MTPEEQDIHQYVQDLHSQGFSTHEIATLLYLPPTEVATLISSLTEGKCPAQLPFDAISDTSTPSQMSYSVRDVFGASSDSLSDVSSMVSQEAHYSSASSLGHYADHSDVSLGPDTASEATPQMARATLASMMGNGDMNCMGDSTTDSTDPGEIGMSAPVMTLAKTFVQFIGWGIMSVWRRALVVANVAMTG